MGRCFQSCGFLFCFLFPIGVLGQDTLFHEEVWVDSTSESFGWGRRHFAYFRISWGTGFGLPAEKGASTHFWGSGLFEVGGRYKLRLFEHLETGLGLKYEREAYRLEQSDEKKVFGPTQHEKEKLILHDLGASYYFRFVFADRGDFMGTYLDLGAYGDLSLGKRHLVVEKVSKPSQTGFREVKLLRKGLTFVRDLHYGFCARLGYSTFSLFARYRYSDLFKEEGIASSYPELPRFQLGIELGLPSRSL